MYQVVIEKSNKKQKMKKVELPSIDISALTTNDARKRTGADELIEAFEEVGFAVLVGHGIEKKRLSEMRELLINVFSIPDSVKEELSISSFSIKLGWTSLKRFSNSSQSTISFILSLKYLMTFLSG